MTVPSNTLRLTGLLSLTLMLSTVLSGCDLGFPGSEGQAPVDRETFIQTFVELRVEALQWESGRIPEAEKVRILEHHGVSEDDLRGFIETHGRNVPYMNEVWAEIADRVQAEMEPEDEEMDVPDLPGS